MVLYVAIVIGDIRVSYLNPPDVENDIPLPINFYLSNESYLTKLHEGTADYYVEVDVFYNGTLTVRKPVLALAHGYLESQEAISTVSEVWIAFRLSHAYPHQVFAQNLTTFDIAIKLHRYGTNELRGNKIMIYWANSGDFPLIAATFFSDNRPPFVQSSDLSAVHVEPESEIVTERIGRIELGLTIALTYFAFIEGLSTVRDYLQEKKVSQKPNSNQNQSESSKNNNRSNLRNRKQEQNQTETHNQRSQVN
jgi:hypothetical protein